MKKVAVLGSGTVGQTLSKGFEKHGFEVKQVSRDKFAEASKWGDLVVLCVKGAGALSAVELAGADNLKGKTVIDTTNPIDEGKQEDGVLRYFTNQNDSLMEQLQKKAPGAHFVKCFSSVGAPRMVNPDFGGQKPTMFICGDDENAKTETKGILDTFGWETMDCGTAKAARAIEPLCMLWCIPGFKSNHWTHAFKVIGL